MDISIVYTMDISIVYTMDISIVYTMDVSMDIYHGYIHGIMLYAWDVYAWDVYAWDVYAPPPFPIINNIWNIVPEATNSLF